MKRAVVRGHVVSTAFGVDNVTTLYPLVSTWYNDVTTYNLDTLIGR
jgi:hypothetical protein